MSQILSLRISPRAVVVPRPAGPSGSAGLGVSARRLDTRADQASRAPADARLAFLSPPLDSKTPRARVWASNAVHEPAVAVLLLAAWAASQGDELAERRFRGRQVGDARVFFQ